MSRENCIQLIGAAVKRKKPRHAGVSSHTSTMYILPSFKYFELSLFPHFYCKVLRSHTSTMYILPGFELSLVSTLVLLSSFEHFELSLVSTHVLPSFV